MTIIITAFERSPDGGKGLARDTRVRWALEEVGQPYEVRLVSFRAMKEPTHLALHPFGQIPTYEEGDLALFETGRSSSTSPRIMRACCQRMPMPGRARSHGCSPRSIRWSRRSLELGNAKLLEGDGPAHGAPAAGRDVAFAAGWKWLSGRLGDADWLDGAFNAGDLMMAICAAQVEIFGHSGRIPEPAAYVARGESRPAYKRLSSIGSLHGKPRLTGKRTC